MAEPFAGGAALGDMLFGRADTKTYPDQLKRNYEAQDAFAKARIERAKMLARDGLAAAIAKDPDLSKRGDLATSILGMAEGQPNLSTYTGGVGDLNDMALREERQKAMDAGNIVQANKLNAVITDKGYEPLISEDGNLRPSGVGLGDEAFEVMPLPQTLAAIEQKEKLGEAAMIRANKPAAPRSTRAPSAATDESAVLKQARDAIAGGASVEAVKQRLKDRGYGKLAGRL